MLNGLFRSNNGKTGQLSNGNTQTGMTPQRGDTNIGSGTLLTGTLNAEGNVRIAGAFKGDVCSPAYVLIAEGGRLEGDLCCDTAVIAGHVQGNITAKRIAVRGTGKVQGDLRVEQLVSDDGSYVRGVITMEESVDVATLVEARRPVESTPVNDPTPAESFVDDEEEEAAVLSEPLAQPVSTAPRANGRTSNAPRGTGSLKATNGLSNGRHKG